MAGELYDAPNQQVVREDESGPGQPAPGFEIGTTVDGLKVTLSVPAEVTALSYEVRWGDGEPNDYSGPGDETAEHTYALPGDYVIVVDPYGEENTEASTRVSVGGAAPETEPETFDPSEHTVDETKAHLTEHPEDAAAVLDAEKAGQNRTSLVGWIEQRLAAEGTA